MKKSEAIRDAVDRLMMPSFYAKENGEQRYVILEIILEGILSDEEIITLSKDEFEVFAPYEITDTEERQAIRFMYAEFLALMAEDEENEPQ